MIFAIGNKGGKISKVQTVKTGAAVVPESPKLSVVPMMGDYFIGDAWRSRLVEYISHSLIGSEPISNKHSSYH